MKLFPFEFNQKRETINHLWFSDLDENRLIFKQ
jgi:hypothetical protein